MALIKCENCGQMVANTGKCPKCGALICKECGHVLTPTDIKCPNCGRGTDLLSQKLKSGCIVIVCGVFLMTIPPMVGYTVLNPILALCGLVFFVIGFYRLIKYWKIKHYS